MGVIIGIILRKFPDLASLDVENIPAEKEARFKEQIISSRFKRNLNRFGVKTFKYVKIGGKAVGKTSKLVYEHLLSMKNTYDKEKESKVETNLGMDGMWIKFDEAKETGDTDEQERILIEIIGGDSKNLEAFKKLGELYFDVKKYNEANETFKHALKLLENGENEEGISEIYFNLALIEKEKEDLDSALKNIKKALKLEPNNPRYLDTSLEISIIKKDKISALDAYERLAKVNPENGKLEDFKDRIDSL